MARNQSESEDEETKPALTCGACGHTEFLFIEPQVRWYETRIADGVIEVLGNTGESDVDNDRDSVLECESCSRQIPIPHKMEWEWAF